MPCVPVKPTPEQVEWADCEFGVIIHLDLEVFNPSWNYGDKPDLSPAIFNPRQLDTDQWLSAAKAMGAQYAVLVAKHGTGFSLWPTAAHDYSVASSPWRDGKGDIVADFIASCQRFGIRPGLYASTTSNCRYNVVVPGVAKSGLLADQVQYNKVVELQLTELWTRYGRLFEIWFDGGTLAPSEGGPHLADLVNRYQPSAICFQGPEGVRSTIRWPGNERGYVDDPCWSTTRMRHADEWKPGMPDMGATLPMFGSGCADGDLWSPAENDMTNRDYDKAYQGGWFWRAGEDHLVYPVETMIERYYTCIGRNANFVCGMVIDDRGLFPDADVRQFEAVGRELRRRFGTPLASTSGRGNEVTLTLPRPQRIDHAILMEDILEGERVREYVVEVKTGPAWTQVATGQCIGHKRIIRFSAVEASAVRVRVLQSIAEPLLRSVAAYCIG